MYCSCFCVFVASVVYPGHRNALCQTWAEPYQITGLGWAADYGTTPNHWTGVLIMYFFYLVYMYVHLFEGSDFVFVVVCRAQSWLSGQCIFHWQLHWQSSVGVGFR